MAATHDLNIDQGSDFTESFTLKDPQGAALNLTGYSAKMQIRPFKSSDALLIDGTSANGILVITPETGLLEIKLTDVQTSALIYTESVYDLYLEKPSGELLRFLEGKVFVSKSVTR